MTDLYQPATAASCSVNGGVSGIMQDSRTAPICFFEKASPILLHTPWQATKGPVEGTTAFERVLEASSFRDIVNQTTSWQNLHHLPSLSVYLSLFLCRQVKPVKGGLRLIAAGEPTTNDAVCLIMEGRMANTLILLHGKSVTFDVIVLEMAFV